MMFALLSDIQQINHEPKQTIKVHLKITRLLNDSKQKHKQKTWMEWFKANR